MKYDTGMTHLHGDILAAVRLMLYHDTEITKKFSPSDGSPAPLREYLKNGFKHSGKWCDEARYDCNSTGMEISFERPLNNEGDQKLRLSWSQLAAFIRNNWDEVFIGELDFPCDGCGYDKNGCCNYPETKDDYCVLGDKRVPAESVSPTVGESQTTKPESVPPTVGETQIAFDYTLVTAAEADKLRECEAAIRRETAGYFTTLGEKFKEAQELLANNKNGAFEKWYTSLGFKRQTACGSIDNSNRTCFWCGNITNDTESEETTMTLEIKFSGLTPEQALRLINAAAGSNAEAKIAESPTAAPEPVLPAIPPVIQQPAQPVQPVPVQPMIPTAPAAPVIPPAAPAIPTVPPTAPATPATPPTAPAAPSAPPIPTAPPTAIRQYTADELAVAARPLCESPEMREKLLNLLHSFSYTDAAGTVRTVQSIRDMPPELYPELANGIRQLGGRI